MNASRTAWKLSGAILVALLIAVLCAAGHAAQINVTITGATGSGTVTGPTGVLTPPGGVVSVADGTDVTLTITPTPTYFATQTVVKDGASQSPVPTSVSFPAITGNHTLVVTFVRAAYQITPEPFPTDGSLGTVAPFVPTNVNVGSTLSVALTPATGYQVWQYRILPGGAWTSIPEVSTTDHHRKKTVTIASGAVVTADITPITADCTIQFNFVPRFTVTSSVLGGLGTIAPLGVQAADWGDTPAYTMTPQTTPAPSYGIGSINATDQSTGLPTPVTPPTSPYTFPAIQRNSVINVTFVQAQYIITPVSASTAQGDVSPNTAQTVDIGKTITVALTPKTVGTVPYQVYRYSTNGGLTWTVIPSVSATDLHRKTSLVVSAGPPTTGTADIICTGNTTVTFAWEPLYTLTLGFTGPQDYLDNPWTYPGFAPSPAPRPTQPSPLRYDKNRYVAAGTFTVPLVQKNMFFYGDTTAVTVAANNDYKFGEDDGSGAPKPNVTYWFSSPSGMVVTPPTPPSGTPPPPTDINVRMFSDTIVTAWFVRAKTLSWTPKDSRGFTLGTYDTTSTNDYCNNIFEPLDSDVDRGIRYFPMVFDYGVAVQLRYEDEQAVTNPSGPVSMNLKVNTGKPGAILYRPTGFDYTPKATALDKFPPAVPGTVQFGKLQIDRIGVNYQLEVSYPINWCNSGGVRIIPIHDGQWGPSESMLVVDSSPFHILPAEAGHFAWGYNYFGQLGTGMVTPFTTNKTDQTGLPLSANWQGGVVASATAQLSPSANAYITRGTSKSPVGMPGNYNAPTTISSVSWMSGPVNQTEVRVNDTTISGGQRGTISVSIDATGVENGVYFTLAYDEDALSYVAGSAALGAGMPVGTTLTTDSTKISAGYLSFVVGLPAGQTLTKGTHTLLTFDFGMVGVTSQETLYTSWGARAVLDTAGNPVQAAWRDGIVNAGQAVVHIFPTEIAAGATVPVDVVVESFGNENSITFSLQFSPGDVTFVPGSGALGTGVPAGTAFSVDEAFAAAGLVGFTVTLPAGTVLPGGTLQLVTMDFTGVTGNATTISFTGTPTTRGITGFGYAHFHEDGGGHVNWTGWYGVALGESQRWWVKVYAYPDDSFAYGRDMFEPVQPYHQEMSQGFTGNQLAFNAVSAGQHHSLALRATGDLWTWGDNEYGQLGLGPNATPTYVNNTTSPPVTSAFADPQQVTLISDVIGMAAGFHHTIVVTGDGRVWTWGRNNYGQLGLGSTDDAAGGHPTPTVVTGLADIVAVAAGDYYSMALERDGAVWAWGYNADGQVGDGTQTDRATPVQVGVSTTSSIPFRMTKFLGHSARVQSAVVSPTANVNAKYTVLTGSFDKTARLWDRDSGALLRSIGDPTSAGQNAHTGPVNAVAFSPNGAIVLTGSADRTVKLWDVATGRFLGALIDTTLANNTTDAHLGSVTAAAYSADGTRIVTSSIDATAKIWNAATLALVRTITNSPDAQNRTMGFTAGLFSSNGLFIYTASIDQKIAVWNVATGALVGNAVDPAVGGGLAHAGTVTGLAVLQNGANDQLASSSADCSAKLWNVTAGGAASLAQTMLSLFDGNAQGHYDAALCVAITKDAASGITYVLTGSKDGTVKRWLTDGSVNKSYTRHRDWVNAVGFAGTNGNRILTASSDQSAKLGDTPVVVQIEGGTSHSVALKEDGTVWAWGYNNFGQLGDGTQTTRLSPVQTTGITSVAGVSAGNAHTVAVRIDGSVYSWGSNLYGELALGPGTVNNPTMSLTPVRAVTASGAPLSWVQAVSAGWGYTLARGYTGVYAWGHNNHGQLGIDGPAPSGSASQSDQPSATRLSTPTCPQGYWQGGSPMTSLSAGYWHSQIVQSKDASGGAMPYLHTVNWHIDPSNKPLGGAVMMDTTSTTTGSQTGIPAQTTFAYTAAGGAPITSGTVAAASGTRVRLLAVSRPGYTFDHWDGYAPSQIPQTTWMFNNYAENDPATPLELYAHFTAVSRRYQLQILTYVDGVQTVGPVVTGAGTYNENDIATLTATNDTQYKFLTWTDPSNGDAPDIANSKLNPAYLRMDKTKTVIANFTRQQYKLDVSTQPSPTGVTAVGSGTYNYNYTVTVMVSGLSAAGYRFGNWVVDSGVGPIVSTNNPNDPSEATIVITTDTKIHANLIRTWNINVASNPTGIGLISDGIVPAPVLCPFQGTYDDNDPQHPVTLTPSVTTAAMAAGWRFSDWSGDIISTQNPLVIGPVTRSYALQANFVRDNTLTVSINPQGTATYVTSPSKASYVTGEVVTITVTPNDGYRFLFWSQGASGTSLTTQVTMTSDTTVQANLAPISNYAGELMAWGYDLYGALGDGDASRATKFEPVFVDPTLANHVKRLAGGAYHSLAVKADGSVIAWGHNSNGQIGDGTSGPGNDRLTPVQVNGLNWPVSRVRGVAAGDYHSLALRDDGFVFAWGQGLYGQLGNSQTGNVTTPSAIPGLNSIVAVAAGAYHTLALRADGTVWTCGLNNRGQLGDGTQANSFKIVQVVDPMDAAGTGFLQNVVAVAAGDNHSVALKSDGTVWAWGGNNWGQLGDGSTIDSAFPVHVMSGGQPLANVAAVACGSYHTLALVETAPVSGVRVGNVMAWGWNLYGQLADKGSLPQQYSAVPVLAQTASGALDNIVIDAAGGTTLSAGYAYSLALRLHVNGGSTTRIPWAWGRNLVGELGNGMQTDSNIARQVSNANNIRCIMSGKYHGLALVMPVLHTLTGAMTPTAGGASIVAVGLDGTGVVVAPVAPGSAPTFDEDEHVSVTANPQPGYKFSIWTGDLTSQLSTDVLDMTADRSVTANFQLDPLLYGLTVIIAGSGHVNPDKQPDVNPNLYRAGTQVTLTAVADPGFTFSGWTGDVVSLSPVVTVTMSTFRNVTATFISTASFRTITTQSTPIAGGSAIGGGTFALNSTTTLTATPNQGYRFYYWEVDGVTNINDNANPRTVLVDNNHTFTAHFVITSGNPGTLLGWGNNAYGQVGDGSTQDRLQPTPVLTLQNVTEFSAGQYHVLALQSNGSVYAWGDNTNGQLGFSGPPFFSPNPTIVTFAGLPLGVQIKQVAAGGQFSVAVDTAGNVWTWGDNTYGQLGDDSVIPHSAPTQIAGIAGVEGVVAGENHVLALLSDGTVWAWGYNLRGQLGVGDGTDRWVPTQVVDPTDSTGFLTSVEALAAGAMHSVALKTDGKVYAWGFNADGELGNNTTADNAVPVQVLGGMPQITGIGAGSYHSLAVDGSGNVWSWGYNAAGQLGYGTTVSTGAGVPAKVKDTSDATGFLTGVVRVAGGYAHSAAIRSDSTVRAWGDNTWGQLGDLTRLSRTTPVQVMQAPGVPLTDVGAVAAGWTHTTAEINPIYFRVVTSADTPDKGRIDGGGTFVQGATVTLTAVEYAGGQFQRWEVTPSVAGSLTSPTLSFTVDQNYSVIGHFVRNVANAYKLRVNRVPGLPASIIKVDPGATPGTDATGPYYLYTFSPATVMVDNVAAGALGYTFSRWQGPVAATANPLVCNVLMQPQPAKDITITAIFDLLCDLSVDAQTAGGVPLTGTQIDSASYGGVTPYSKLKIQAGTTVDLTVNAASLRRVIGGQTYDFAYWMVNGTQYPTGAARVTFQIAVQPTSAIAVYKALRSISVQSVGVSGVTIVSTPAGYGGTTPYPPPVVNVYDGDSFMLTAPASWPAVNPTHNFSKWTLNGADQPAGQTSLAVGPVTQDVSAVATYVLRRALTVQSSPVGGVAISSTTGQAGTTDATTLVYGAIADDQTLVNLSAPPSVTVASVVYDFVQWKWNGVLQPAGAWVLNQTITANSTAQALYKIRRVLTVQSTGNGSSMPGVVITSATGHGGTTAYSVNTFDQTAIKLTAPVKYANGSVDYNFQAWTVIGATTNISTTSTTASFIISEDVTATAQYTIVQRTLNVWAGKDSATPLSVAMSAAPGSAAGTTAYSRQIGDEQTVVVTAPDTAVSGLNTYSFQRWAIGSTPQPVGQRDVSVTMNAGINLSAYYIPKLWNVSVQSTGDGQSMPGVAITGSRPGRTSYTAQQSDSTTLTLTATTPATVNGTRYAFQVWNVGGVDQLPSNATYTTTLRSDVTAVAKYTVVTHPVAVQSDKLAGVPVTVNGTSTVTTNTVVQAPDNAALTLVATQTGGTSGGTDYTFDHWTLNGVAQTKGQTTLVIPAVKVDTITAVAVYAVVQRALTVDSTPTGVTVTVNSAAHTTYYATTIPDNSALTLTAPQNATIGGTSYVFNVWSINSVDQTAGVLTFNNGGAPVKADVAAVAKYGYVQRTVQVQSTGVTGVLINVTGGSVATVTTNGTVTANDNANVTFTAPATVLNGTVTYYFKRWVYDGVLQNYGKLDVTVPNIKVGHLVSATYGDDNVPPVVTLESPQAGTTEVALDSLIKVLVTDAKSGVDYKGVTITVNGAKVYDGAAETSPATYDTSASVLAVRGVCRRIAGPTANDWRFVFMPSVQYGYGQPLAVVVNAMDKQSVPVTATPAAFAAQARTFTASVKVNNPDNSQLAHSHVAATIDNLGTQYVIWDQVSALGDTNLYLCYRPAGSTTFSPMHTVPESTPNSFNQSYPSIAWSAVNNRVYIAWQDNRYGQWDIFVAYATAPALSSWTTKRVTLGGVARTRPAIGVDASGTLYLAWEEAVGAVRNIHVASSTNGTTFAPVTTASSIADQSEPCLAVSTLDNSVYVLWTDARNVGTGHSTDIYGFSSASWVAVPVANDPAGQSSPALAIEPGTTMLHIAWAGLKTGNSDIFYASSAGLPAGPLAGVNVTQDAAAQILPAINVTGSGNDARIYLAWQDGRQPTTPGETDIYFADIRPGAVPSTTPPWVNVLVNTDAVGSSSQSWPKVIVDATKQPAVFWSDTRNGGLDIYANAGTAVGANVASDTTAVDHTKATVRQVMGAPLGKDGVINGPTDVLVQIPANAMAQDAVVSIAPLTNPPKAPPGGFGVPYHFGPSGLQFTTPVTVYTPHAADACPLCAAWQVYYYDPLDVASLTAPWSQNGISNVQHVVISATLHAVKFQTTHFSAYATSGTGTTSTTTSGGSSSGSSSSSGGGGGGGGCFIATAAYGEGGAGITPENLDHLTALRGFRRSVLMPTELGRKATSWYSAVSPAVAEQLEHSTAARQAVRQLFVNPLAQAVGGIVEEAR